MSPAYTTRPTLALLKELYPVGSRVKADEESKTKLTCLRTTAQIFDTMFASVGHDGKYVFDSDDAPAGGLPEGHICSYLNAMRASHDNAESFGKTMVQALSLSPGVPMTFSTPEARDLFNRGRCALAAVVRGPSEALPPRISGMMATLLPLHGVARLANAFGNELVAQSCMAIANKILQSRYPEILWMASQYVHFTIDMEACEVEVVSYRIDEAGNEVTDGD